MAIATFAAVPDCLRGCHGDVNARIYASVVKAARDAALSEGKCKHCGKDIYEKGGIWRHLATGLKPCDATMKTMAAKDAKPHVEELIEDEESDAV